MAEEMTIKGKWVKVSNNGEIYVNGSTTRIKQWESDKTRYSNLSGSEQKHLKGLDLEKALEALGLV